jgi:branched-chain amino acid transport system substrate-binding protein
VGGGTTGPTNLGPTSQSGSGPAGPTGAAGSTSSAGGGTGGSTGVGATGGRASGAPSGATSPGGASTAQADHSPIAIGSVGSYSGLPGNAQAPGVIALEAWTSWVNAHGGVNGHPIKLYVRDDQSDAGQNLADTQALVQQEHIVAEVSAWAVQTQQASASYLDQNHISVVGGDGGSEDAWGVRPNFFPEGDITDTTVENAVSAGARVLFPKGQKNLAILVCQEASVCPHTQQVDAKYAPTIGWNIVYNQSASFAAPSYTAQCLQMKSANAQAVVLVMPASVTATVAKDCDQQGYDPAYLLGYGISEGNFNSIPALRNSIIYSSAFPFAGAPVTPPISEYYQAMKQYEPNQILDPATAAGWASAKIFQAAVEKVTGPVTPATLMAALQTLKGTFGGLTIPLDYSHPPVNPQPCWFLMLIQNSQWVTPYGDTPQCR